MRNRRDSAPISAQSASTPQQRRPRVSFQAGNVRSPFMSRVQNQTFDMTGMTTDQLVQEELRQEDTLLTEKEGDCAALFSEGSPMCHH